MYIDCHTHVGIELGQYLNNGFPYGQHLPDLVHEGQGCGIDRFMVFPMVTNLTFNLAELRQERVVIEDGLETVPYAWENRRLMFEIYELFPEEGKSALPLAMFDPSRNTAEQGKALRALKADFKFVGLKTQPTMLQSPITALHEQGRIFLELAEEWDLPMLIHSSVLPSDIWSQASDIIDIAEKFPNVRFCVAHSCRFDKPSLDRIAALPNAWFDCSAHGIHCELALQDSPVVAPVGRRFDSDYSRPEVVLAHFAEAYPDKLMWGSDAPYYSFAARMPGGDRIGLISTFKLEADYFHALPEEARHKAGYANTLAFLGVDSLD